MKFRDLFDKSKKNNSLISTLKNSFWLIIQQVYKMLLGVFVTAAITRYFGPELYGKYNYVLSLVTIFSALSTLGLDSFIVKEIVEKKNTESQILGSSIIMRLIGGLFIPILSLTLYGLTREIEFVVLILLIIMSFSFVFKAFEVIELWMQAHHISMVSSIIRMSIFSITSLLNILLIVFRGNLIYLGGIYFLNIFLIAIFLTIFYFTSSKSPKKLSWNKLLSFQLLSKSYIIFFSGFLGTLYMQIDRILLNLFGVSDAQIGLYAAANTLSSMWFFVPLALITSLSPVIMRLKNKSDKEYIDATKRMYSIVIYLSLFFIVFIFAFANPLVDILFGNDYYVSGSLTMVLIWYGLFALLGSARQVWLISENLEKYSLVFAIFGVLTNIIMNLSLIPLIGTFGSAIASVVTQAVVGFFAPLIFPKTRPSSLLIIKALNPKCIFSRRIGL